VPDLDSISPTAFDAMLEAFGFGSFGRYIADIETAAPVIGIASALAFIFSYDYYIDDCL
jgi:hypothetical protein